MRSMKYSLMRCLLWVWEGWRLVCSESLISREGSFEGESRGNVEMRLSESLMFDVRFL